MWQWRSYRCGLQGRPVSGGGLDYTNDLINSFRRTNVPVMDKAKMDSEVGMVLHYFVLLDRVPFYLYHN